MTDDTQREVIVDTCPSDLGKHLILISARFDMSFKFKAVTRDYMEQMRHNARPMESGEVAGSAGEKYEGKWEAVRAMGRAKGKGNAHEHQNPQRLMASQQGSRAARDRRAGPGDNHIPTTSRTITITAEQRPHSHAFRECHRVKSWGHGSSMDRTMRQRR